MTFPLTIVVTAQVFVTINDDSTICETHSIENEDFEDEEEEHSMQTLPNDHCIFLEVLSIQVIDFHFDLYYH